MDLASNHVLLIFPQPPISLMTSLAPLGTPGPLLSVSSASFPSSPSAFSSGMPATWAASRETSHLYTIARDPAPGGRLQMLCANVACPGPGGPVSLVHRALPRLASPPWPHRRIPGRPASSTPHRSRARAQHPRANLMQQDSPPRMQACCVGI
jgi:hypothetical protein